MRHATLVVDGRTLILSAVARRNRGCIFLGGPRCIISRGYSDWPTDVKPKGKKKLMDLASSSFNLSNLYHIFFTLGCLFLLWILSYTYPYRFTPSLVRLVFWWSFHLLNVYHIN